MSRIVVIEKNKDGKLKLTKEELQKMLDDAYRQGYVDAKYPSYPWCTTVASTADAMVNNTKNTEVQI